MDALYEPPSKHPWIDTLKKYLQPDWDAVATGEWVTNVNQGIWSADAIRGCILQLYPFIHAFPKFLAEALIKVEDEYSRSFLIDNIRVEKAHAEHWIWMGEGFGLHRRDMIALADGERAIMRDVQSLSDWIWYINAKGSLAEAVAATSFAIEGVTGDLSRAVLKGFEAYGSRDGVRMSPRTSRWFRNHAKYDDEHPRIALEVVARYAVTDRAQMKVMAAARRSLQLLNLALLTSSYAYSESAPIFSQGGLALGDERRRLQESIGFPDRRIVDHKTEAASPETGAAPERRLA